MTGNYVARAQSGSVSGYRLAGIAVGLSLLGIAATYVLDALARPAARPDTRALVTRVLGGVELSIPRDWLAGEEPQAPEFARQVDLRVPVALATSGTALPVRVTLLPRSRVRPSSALLDAVYVHEFGAEQLKGAPGLVGKPLQAEAGLGGETVWYDPLAASPFVAKCTELPDGAAQCLRVIHLGPGVGAVYSFPATALDDWRSFDRELDARMRSIGAL